MIQFQLPMEDDPDYMEAKALLPDVVLSEIANRIGAQNVQSNRDFLRQVVILVIRLISLRSILVKDPDRLDALSSALIDGTLGHTRAG